MRKWIKYIVPVSVLALGLEADKAVGGNSSSVASVATFGRS
jgi:hypothetical protein